MCNDKNNSDKSQYTWIFLLGLLLVCVYVSKERRTRKVNGSYYKPRLMHTSGHNRRGSNFSSTLNV